jgi:hypothetical protein
VYLETPAKRRAEKGALALGYPRVFSHGCHPNLYTLRTRKKLHGAGPQKDTFFGFSDGGERLSMPLLILLIIIPHFFGERNIFLNISTKSPFSGGLDVLSA